MNGAFLLSYERQYRLLLASEAVIEGLDDEIRLCPSSRERIRFGAAKSITVALVTKIIRIRVAEDAARANS